MWAWSMRTHAARRRAAARASATTRSGAERLRRRVAPRWAAAPGTRRCASLPLPRRARTAPAAGSTRPAAGSLEPQRARCAAGAPAVELCTGDRARAPPGTAAPSRPGVTVTAGVDLERRGSARRAPGRSTCSDRRGDTVMRRPASANVKSTASGGRALGRGRRARRRRRGRGRRCRAAREPVGRRRRLRPPGTRSVRLTVDASPAAPCDAASAPSRRARRASPHGKRDLRPASTRRGRAVERRRRERRRSRAGRDRGIRRRSPRRTGPRTRASASSQLRALLRAPAGVGDARRARASIAASAGQRRAAGAAGSNCADRARDAARPTFAAAREARPGRGRRRRSRLVVGPLAPARRRRERLEVLERRAARARATPKPWLLCLLRLSAAISP